MRYVCRGAVTGLLLTSSVIAQTNVHAVSRLVKDIYPGQDQSMPNGYGSDPDHFCMVGGILYFSAAAKSWDRELWRSDGTAGGTYQVKDIYPGENSESRPEELTRLGALVIFRADSPGYGAELWRSDGTGAGTVMIKDILPGSGSSSPQGGSATDPKRPVGFTYYRGRLYFSAYDGNVTQANNHGRELWRTDGTTTGTVMVADVSAGGADSTPRSLTVLKDSLYFWARDYTGCQLWRTDGTAQGTRKVQELVGGFADGLDPELTVMGDHLYFVAIGSNGLVGLWRTDGLTISLADNDIPAMGSSSIRGLTVVGDQLFFRADHPFFGNEVWRSNGQVGGTLLVRDVWPGKSSSWTRPIEESKWPNDDMCGSDTLFFFRATDGINGGQLYRSDGTSAGTYPVGDLAPGIDDKPYDVRSVGNGVLFTAETAILGPRAYFYSDGNVGGTHRIPGLLDSVESEDRKIVRAGFTQCYFAATGMSGVGEELWALSVPYPIEAGAVLIVR